MSKRSARGSTARLGTASLAACLAFGLVVPAANAAGDNDPFPFRVPGMTFINPPAYVDTGANAYPSLAERPSRMVFLGGADAMPMTGSQAGVETANSRPPGFTDGVGHAQARSARSYLSAERASPSMRAARTAPRVSSAPRS